MSSQQVFFAILIAAAAGSPAHAQAPSFSPPGTPPHDSRTEIPEIHLGLPAQIRVLPLVTYAAAPPRACYAMRSYNFTSDDGSGRVTPQGSTTCQSAATSRLRAIRKP